MSKTKKINIVVFVLLILLSVIYFLPQLLSPQFNLIDDGYSLRIAHDLATNPQNFWQILVGKEAALGRMRPLYYIYYFVLYLIAGTNPFIFWLGQILSLVITVFLVYLVINHLLKKPFLSALGSSLIFLFPSTVENFLRLGPAEARQMIWVLWGVLIFFKFIERKTHKLKSIFALFLVWLAPVLIKETSFIFLGLYGFIFTFLAVFKIDKKKNWLLAGGSLLLMLLTFLIIPKGGDGYTSALSLSLSTIKNNFFIVRAAFPEFWWLLMVGGIIWVANLLRTSPLSNKKSKLFLAEELTIFLAALGNFLLPLFWPYQLERYYYPAHLFVLIFFVIQAHKLLNHLNLKNKKDLLSLFAIFALTLIISLTIFIPSTLNPRRITDRYQTQRISWYEEYQYNGALVDYLLKTDLRSEQIFADDNDHEIVYEISLYASNFSSGNNSSIETSTLFIKRGNNVDEGLTLWPQDSSLINPQQIWTIKKNNSTAP